MATEEQVLLDHIRARLGIDVSLDQIGGDHRLDGVWWIMHLTDEQRELVVRQLQDVLFRVSAKEQVEVLERAHHAAKWIAKKSSRKMPARLFRRLVDTTINLAGLTGKKDAVLESAFALLKARAPELELNDYDFPTLKTYHYRGAKKR